MKLLFCERNLFMQRDIEEALSNMGIDFRCVSYIFSDPDQDEFFYSHLRSFLTEDRYDAVLSVNLVPVIADVCHEMGIPYLAWCYDACWEFSRSDIFYYPTTYIFHFDQRSCDDYKQCGYANVYHMPLAANCRRLDSLIPPESHNYQSQLCFLGSMYEKYQSERPWFACQLHPEDYTNLMHYIAKQTLLYSHHTLWDDITKEYVEMLSSRTPSGVLIHRIPLIATCSSIIAGRQRNLVLHKLAEKYSLTLYSNAISNPVKNADYKWRASYYSQMPFIFRHAIVNLNITIPPIQTGLSLRVLDILGAGGFLLSNAQDELSEFFQIGQDLDTYENFEELQDKVSFYLSHPEITRQLARNGHSVVQKNFSFEQQLSKIFTLSGLLS